MSSEIRSEGLQSYDNGIRTLKANALGDTHAQYYY